MAVGVFSVFIVIYNVRFFFSVEIRLLINVYFFKGVKLGDNVTVLFIREFTFLVLEDSVVTWIFFYYMLRLISKRSLRIVVDSTRLVFGG